MGSIAIIPAVLAAFSAWLYYLSTIAPKYSENDYSLGFPGSLEDLKQLSQAFEFYKKENGAYVVILFTSAYLYKQTFAIPGSVFLNVLAGALYGQAIGFVLVCLLTSCGASLCYLLSSYCGKYYVEKYLSSKLKKLQEKVAERNDDLFSFLLFIRLFPMTPNWFINIASPILNIPLHLFFISVFIGLMPYHMLCIQTGAILTKVQSLDDIFTGKVLVGLLSLSVIAILPTAIRKLFFNQNKK